MPRAKTPTQPVGVRFSKEQIKQLKQAAQAKGLTLAGYIRMSAVSNMLAERAA